MAKEFIEKRIGSADLAKAQRQQKELSYFTESKPQDEVTEAYVNQWFERNYRSEESFINWVKMLLRTENFMSFFKYFRYPVPSSEIVQNKILPQLERIFYSEDAYFKYVINGDHIQDPDELDCSHFRQQIFKDLLFRYNDVIIHDLYDVNEPFREVVSIDDVVAIESKDSKIKRIAYSGKYSYIDDTGNETEVKGYVYMDDKVYAFYDKAYNVLNESPHDLGKCPAIWVSKEPFSKDSDVVRKSIFSFVRSKMEDYCFMSTLQKLTDTNGTFPIVTMVKSKSKSSQNKDKGTISDKEPMTAREIGGQQSDEFQSTVQGSYSPVQPGTVFVLKPPLVSGGDGGVDMDYVRNFINFHHFPTDILEFIDKRVRFLEESLEKTIVGELADQTGERKNEKQVGAGFVSAQDRLRGLSAQMSRLNNKSDWMFLALKYGPANVMVDIFYGSDFFLESQADLYELFEKSPNPIERKNILKRLAQNRNRFNKDKSKREQLLYDLMPYSSDKDLETAINQSAVDRFTLQLQTRFNYWISLFEAKFGDLVQFWDSVQSTESEKLIMINNLLIEIIKQVLPEQEQQTEPAPQNQP